MNESTSSKSAGRSASAATGTDAPEGVPNTTVDARIADNHEPVSAVATANDRYYMAWRQVLNDDQNTEGLFATIRESYSRETWTALGFTTFGGFCRERLGVDENEMADILIRHFGMKRYRLLTASASQQGYRSDLESTSRNECGKFGLRMDTLVRTTLVAIERAPELERLVTSDLLPWELGAKLGNTDLSETQIDKVKQLGAQVAELMTLPVAKAKRRIRQEVEAIIGKRKSAATQLAERLCNVSKDDLREALASVPRDLLRQVLPPELLGVDQQESSQDLAEPLSEAKAVTSGRGDQSQVATEGTESTPVAGGVQSDEPRHVGSANRAKQPRQVPDWDLLDNAPTRPLDTQIGELGPDTSDVSRLVLPSDGLQLKDVLGEDLTLFRAKTINHRKRHITAASAMSQMCELAEGEDAPPGAVVAFVYTDESGNICSEGFGRVSQDGRLPDHLVFVPPNAGQALVIIRGPRTAPCFGAEAAVLVHGPEAMTTDEAAEK